MSILVKGMTAEQLLDVFQLARIGANNCMIGHGVVATELPDHGDLIDRDETAHEMWMKECYECNRVYVNNGCKGCSVTRMINVILCAETAPAVIPAERNEE